MRFKTMIELEHGDESVMENMARAAWSAEHSLLLAAQSTVRGSHSNFSMMFFNEAEKLHQAAAMYGEMIQIEESDHQRISRIELHTELKKAGLDVGSVEVMTQ